MMATKFLISMTQSTSWTIHISFPTTSYIFIIYFLIHERICIPRRSPLEMYSSNLRILLLMLSWFQLRICLNLNIFRAEKIDLQKIAMLIASEKYKIQWPLPTEPLTTEIFVLIQIEHDRLLENYAKSEISPRYLCVLKDTNTENDANKSDDVIGYFDLDCSVECMNEYRNPTPYISDFAVNPLWRQQGIGSYMLDCADQICVNEWGVDRVHLWVDTDNIAAVRLYGKSGFVPIFGYPTTPLSSVTKPTNQASKNEDLWGPLVEIDFPEEDVKSGLNEMTSGLDRTSWAYNQPFLNSYHRLLTRKLIL